jgi:hypothetical protein
MPLTKEQRAAGRAWREQCRAALSELNKTSPPDLPVLAVTRHTRHNCSARGGLSKSFELREHYDLSPDGILAWIWKEGKCACGMTGRSVDGYIVDARTRPPLGRTA